MANLRYASGDSVLKQSGRFSLSVVSTFGGA
jgi:hypothetical protein